jgi:hypothetical protein
MAERATVPLEEVAARLRFSFLRASPDAADDPNADWCALDADEQLFWTGLIRDLAGYAEQIAQVDAALESGALTDHHVVGEYRFQRE